MSLSWCGYVPVPIEPQYHISIIQKPAWILGFPHLAINFNARSRCWSGKVQDPGITSTEFLSAKGIVGHTNQLHCCKTEGTSRGFLTKSGFFHEDCDRLFLGSIFQVRFLLVLWEDWKNPPIGAHHSHPKPTVLVVGDLVVSVIMEGASVLARVKKLLTQPCNRDICRGSCLVSEISDLVGMSIVPIVHYKLCCTEGTIFTSVGKLLLFFASPWISQHCAFPCTEECGLEPVVLVHPRPPCFGIYVMPIVYAFVVYKVDKTMILNFKPIYKGDRIFHDNPAPRGESGHYLGMFPGLLNSIIERIANHIAAAHGILEVLHALVPYGGKGNAGKWAGEESLRLGPKVIQWEEAEALIAVTFTVRDPNAFVLHNLAVDTTRSARKTAVTWNSHRLLKPRNQGHFWTWFRLELTLGQELIIRADRHQTWGYKSKNNQVSHGERVRGTE